MTEIQLPPTLKCKRCRHEWTPRVKDVKVCPRCKSPYWNEELKKNNTDGTKVYARPRGEHYHMKRDCPMLTGGQFEKMGYKEITPEDIVKRKLRPCACVRNTRRETNRKEE